MSNEPSVYEFFERFPDEEAAFEYIEARRWPNGIACPICGSTAVRSWPKPHYHRCGDCNKVYTVRTGTIFERSHVPLHKWLFAMYLTQVSRKGVSSVQLAKQIGVTQKTAWFMLHRIREACEPKKVKLDGVVEVDETYLGGKPRNKDSRPKPPGPRGIYNKQPVIGFRQRQGKVVMVPIQHTRIGLMEETLRAWIEEGATVYTDGHGSYNRLDQWYDHSVTSHDIWEYYINGVHTNSVESIWAVLKRGYHGIYHQFSPKHTHRYGWEFGFRLSNPDAMDAIDKIVHGAFNKRLTYEELTK